MPFLRYWLPVAIWTALILSISSPRFSADETGRWIERLVGREVSEAVNTVARKAGHVAGYAILGALAFRAVANTRASGAWTVERAAAALTIAFAVASLDEWNQSRIPTRTGTPWDVALDVAAAAVAVFAIIRLMRREGDARTA